MSVRSRVLVWGTTPITCLASAGCATTSMPATIALPPVGMTRVVSMPAVVVLPAPLGPSSPKISPGVDGQVKVVDRQHVARIDLGELLAANDFKDTGLTGDGASGERRPR